MEETDKILSDYNILGKLNEHGLTPKVKQSMIYYANKRLREKEVLHQNQNTGKSLIPHRCPVCGGNGLVSGAFYTSLLGAGCTSSSITEKCKSCVNGIIWG